MYPKVQTTKKVIGFIPCHAGYYLEFFAFPNFFHESEFGNLDVLNHLLPPTLPFPVLIIVSGFTLLLEVKAFSSRIS